MPKYSIPRLPLMMGLIPFLVAVNTSFISAQNWSSIRGDNGSGIWNGKTVLSESKDIGLKIRWKKEIGSGYSSVVVADGKAITMFTDGKDDKISCFDVRNGDEIWSNPIEPIYKGSNGSFDGPIATPVVHQGKVYALSARGVLFCFDLKNGKQNWKRNLVKEEEATQPMYGFSTTPVVTANTLCILAGTKKGALIGLDPKTGATKWRVAEGRIASQIPVATRIGGKEVVITGAGQNVIGVDPNNGKLLFEFAHKGSNGSAMMPVPIDGNRILLTNDDSFSKVFEIKPSETGFDVSEIWKDRSIKNTYNVPVASGGNFYAYSTRILTCVDQKTGKPRWKSRKPGDGFLIEVDGHLVIVTKKGSLHLAKTSAEKYSELANIKVFDNLVWAIPAYSDNAIFVRSLKEIACVEFVNRNKSGIVSEKNSQVPLGSAFTAFLDEVNSTNDKTKKLELVTEYLKSKNRFPIVEEGIAHFVFRGDAEDVALACDVFGARQEEKMIRLNGTDFFYYGMKLPADQRVSYVFLKNYKPQIDPLNSRKMTSSMYAGEMEFAIRLRNEKPLEMSWFGMQDWKVPQWMLIHRSERLAGKIVDKKIKVTESVEFDTAIYLPPGYDEKTDKRYPVIYVHDGTQALELGEIDEAADLFFQSQPDKAAIVVFLKSAPTLGLPLYLNRVAKSVVPYVDKNYRTKANRDSRASYGAGFASGMSLALATQHSDLFGACSAQSPLVFDQARKMAIDGFEKVNKSTRVYLEWGRFDMHNPVENWDIREMAKVMKSEIVKNTNVKMFGGQVNDSTDWGSWRMRFDKVVDGLFAKEKTN